MFLLIVSIFLIILTTFLEKFKLGKIINFIVVYAIIFAIVGYVEFTPDKEFYIYWLYDTPESIEPFFRITADYLVKHEYAFPELQIFFTFIYTFLLLFLITRFSEKIFIIGLLYVGTIFLFYVTQLRYFMGYYAICLGLYYLYVKKNYFTAALFMAFGIANHYGLVLFAVIIPFFYIKPDKLISRLFTVTVIVLCVTSILLLLGTTSFSQIRFVAYFFSELQSTFLGGLLTFLPYAGIVYMIYRLHIMVVKINPEILKDRKYIFLLIMSIANITLIGAALIIQVIGHRMIMTATLFQLLYVFYILPYFEKNEKFRLLAGFGGAIAFLYFYLYIFMDLILEKSNNDDIISVLKSSPVLNYFIL